MILLEKLDQYEFEAQLYDMKEKKILLILAVIDLIENNWTLRRTAQNDCCSRSTLHRFIHTELCYISIELYDCAIHVLTSHRRGGK